MSRECDERNGINLGQGICDQPMEAIIKVATIEAVQQDRSTYSPFEGLAPLRQRIAAKMQDYNGISCDPDTEVLVTVGATGAFVIACLSLIEPGDEVILFSPFYGYHRHILELCGARLRYVDTTPPDWRFDLEQLQSVFSRRTRAVIVNTPANPSGKVFTDEENREIARLCQQHDAIAITDEIYEYILYGNTVHRSLGALEGMEDRTITISGFSKTYSMTGWRLGYLVCQRALAKRLGVINDLLYICAPTPLQHGVLAAFDLPPQYYEEMQQGYDRKLDMMASACTAIGMRPFLPQGAYYLLADLGELPFEDDLTAASGLLEQAGVACVPGSSFYPEPEAGRRQLRFCFAKKEEDLAEACRRLREAFA